MPPYWASITSSAVVRVFPRRSTCLTAADLQAGETSLPPGTHRATRGSLTCGVARVRGPAEGDGDADRVPAAVLGGGLGVGFGAAARVHPASTSPLSTASAVRRLTGSLVMGTVLLGLRRPPTG
jgi:hypothetical protein